MSSNTANVSGGAKKKKVVKRKTTKKTTKPKRKVAPKKKTGNVMTKRKVTIKGVKRTVRKTSTGKSYVLLNGRKKYI